MTAVAAPKKNSTFYTEDSNQLKTLKNDTFQKNNQKIDVIIPKKDFVPLSFDVNYEKKGVLNDDYTMKGGIYDVEVKNKLFSGRSLIGKVNGKNVDLKIIGSTWYSNKGSLSGQIDEENINLGFEELKNGSYKVTGDMDEQKKDFIPALTLLVSDKLSYDKQEEEMMIMADMAK